MMWEAEEDSPGACCLCGDELGDPEHSVCPRCDWGRPPHDDSWVKCSRCGRLGPREPSSADCVEDDDGPDYELESGFRSYDDKDALLSDVEALLARVRCFAVVNLGADGVATRAHRMGGLESEIDEALRLLKSRRQ